MFSAQDLTDFVDLWNFGISAERYASLTRTERVNQLNKMPYEIKKKLRQYDNANKKAKMLHDEVSDLFEEYGVPYDNLASSHSNYNDEPNTEGLAYINNSEGHIESNIAEIEEVFLHFVNK